MMLGLGFVCGHGGWDYTPTDSDGSAEDNVAREQTSLSSVDKELDQPLSNGVTSTSQRPACVLKLDSSQVQSTLPTTDSSLETALGMHSLYIDRSSNDPYNHSSELAELSVTPQINDTHTNVCCSDFLGLKEILDNFSQIVYDLLQLSSTCTTEANKE